MGRAQPNSQFTYAYRIIQSPILFPWKLRIFITLGVNFLFSFSLFLKKGYCYRGPNSNRTCATHIYFGYKILKEDTHTNTCIKPFFQHFAPQTKISSLHKKKIYIYIYISIKTIIFKKIKEHKKSKVAKKREDNDE